MYDGEDNNDDDMGPTENLLNKDKKISLNDF
jgi:hypothetical protein